MEKIIDINLTIYEITSKYPEVIDIMTKLGFGEIKKKAIRESIGKIIKLKQGSKMRGISIEKVIEMFIENDFDVIDSSNELDELIKSIKNKA